MALSSNDPQYCCTAMMAEHTIVAWPENSSFRRSGEWFQPNEIRTLPIGEWWGSGRDGDGRFAPSRRMPPGNKATNGRRTSDGGRGIGDAS